MLLDPKKNNLEFKSLTIFKTAQIKRFYSFTMIILIYKQYYHDEIFIYLLLIKLI